MLTKPTVLMQEADASPGGGADPTSQPTEPQATPAAFDVGELAKQVAAAVTATVTADLEAKLTASQNATFATLRKAGVFKEAKAANTEPQAAPSNTANPAPVSMQDVEAVLKRDRVITSLVAKHSLNDKQERRFRDALNGVPIETLGAEADAYLADLGLIKTPSNQDIKPAPAPTAPKPPVPDPGAAAPTNIRDSESIALNRPREITSHDLDALVAKHGHAKAMSMWADAVMRDLRSYKVVPDNRRQR